MQIIGQERVLDQIKNWEKVPRFIIIKGGKGCGKTLIMNEIVAKLQCLAVECDYKVDNVREMLETAYAIQTPIVYFMENAEKMSVASRNSLLKVTEEPPLNAYIVLMTSDDLIGTLKSRAAVIEMQRYEYAHFEEYSQHHGLTIPKGIQGIALCNACSSFDELQYVLVSGDYETHIELGEKVITSMDRVSFGNAFKLVNSFALKKDAEGLDPVFFLKYVSYRALLELNKTEVETTEFDVMCIIQSECCNSLELIKKDSYSKQAIMDIWVLKIIQRIEEIC